MKTDHSTSRESAVVCAPPAPAREGKTMPKAIKARVNQLAHRRSQQYELMVRETVIRELQGMADAGVTLAELSAAMDAIEADAGVPG